MIFVEIIIITLRVATLVVTRIRIASLRLPTYINILGTTIEKELKALPRDIADFMSAATVFSRKSTIGSPRFHGWAAHQEDVLDSLIEKGYTECVGKKSTAKEIYKALIKVLYDR